MITFKRKVIYNNGSYSVNIPIEIAKALKLQKGDTVEIAYNNGSFTIAKVELEA